MEEVKSSDLQNLNESELEVYTWLNNVVELPQYFELFVKDGYDEMETVMEMNDEELQEIGIDKKGHRKRILRHIHNKSHQHPLSQQQCAIYKINCNICDKLFPLEQLFQCSHIECNSTTVYCRPCGDHYHRNKTHALPIRRNDSNIDREEEKKMEPEPDQV